MKKMFVAAIALSLLSGAAAPVFAQGRAEIRHDRRDIRQDKRELRQDRRWARGQRLPAEYRGSRYYVNDWQAHRLQAPPRGYRWVRRDNDYLLVAATTGLIASVIAASR